MSQYTECEKLKNVADESQKLGEFLAWLTGSRGLELSKWVESDGDDRLVPVHFDINELLAEYYDIDLNKVETERRDILSKLRV